MKPLTRHTLHLTPLSPLHLGTGEDYEPTNYLITDGVLYTFDPARAILNPEQERELHAAAQSGDLQHIQRYFRKHPAPYAAVATHAATVSEDLTDEYKKKIGNAVQQEQNGNKVFNKFQIERTTTNPQTHQPYIPGSAIKGCFRTVLLENNSKQYSATEFKKQLTFIDNKGKTQNKNEKEQSKIGEIFEKELIGGEFEQDFMRLYKPSDLMPTNNRGTCIIYAVNHEKDPEEAARDNSTICVRREIIPHGQYRAFVGGITLQQLQLEHNPHLTDKTKDKLVAEKNRNPNLTALALQSKNYYLPRFIKENKILKERGLIDTKWLNDVQTLLDKLKTEIDSGKIILMRLGKNTGAENKTLKNFANIKVKISQKEFEYLEESTTVWLASPKEKAYRDLLPFGWVLIEIDASGDNPALKNWCDNNSAHLKKAAEQLAASAAKIAVAVAQSAAASQAAAAQAAAEQAEAARLAALPAHERLAHDILSRLSEHAKTYSDRNQEKNLQLHRIILEELQQAANNLDPAARTQLADALAFPTLNTACKGFYSGKKEKEIKAALRQLRGEA